MTSWASCRHKSRPAPNSGKGSPTQPLPSAQPSSGHDVFWKVGPAAGTMQVLSMCSAFPRRRQAALLLCAFVRESWQQSIVLRLLGARACCPGCAAALSTAMPEASIAQRNHHVGMSCSPVCSGRHLHTVPCRDPSLCLATSSHFSSVFVALLQVCGHTFLQPLAQAFQGPAMCLFAYVLLSFSHAAARPALPASLYTSLVPHHHGHLSTSSHSQPSCQLQLPRTWAHAS